MGESIQLTREVDENYSKRVIRLISAITTINHAPT